ncbi:hypothetical protein CJ030_MR4G005988 [Morella rubra]|uniref:Pentatricopeptide repeat-containing protein n=1 Tax=Morella rubra TaxID=262757 RepID=A0A6A1VRQ7_9ROSI|nr:hypothetical protein CJ030_MR4G005988 [Morella rubra]
MVLDPFREMRLEGVPPNQFMLSSVLNSSSSISDLQTGKIIHGWILRNGINLDILLENSIIDIYAICWPFYYAKNLFELMVERDTVSWNIMVGPYLHVGDMENSLGMFRSLPHEDVASWNTIMDGLTRNGHGRAALELLHSGLLEEGYKYFRLMKEVYGIKPKVEYFTCVVDLYGRAGHLDNAEEFI